MKSIWIENNKKINQTQMKFPFWRAGMVMLIQIIGAFIAGGILIYMVIK